MLIFIFRSQFRLLKEYHFFILAEFFHKIAISIDKKNFLPLFKYANFLIERKKYKSILNGQEIIISGVGLVNLKKLWTKTKSYKVKNSNEVNNLAQSSYLLDKSFYLFIDNVIVEA